MISTVILVHAEFDIARGCKMLRTHVASQHWKPAIAARGTAILTAMGDLILSSRSSDLVAVNLTIHNTGQAPNIQMTCHLYLPHIHTPQVEAIIQRMRRASDHLDLYETAGNVEISARLDVK